MRASWPHRGPRVGRIGGPGPARRPEGWLAVLGFALALTLGLTASASSIPTGLQARGGGPAGGAPASGAGGLTSGAGASSTAGGSTASATATSPALDNLGSPGSGLAGGGDTAVAIPASADPQDLTGYVWPVHDARITTWFGPIDSGGFVMFGDQAGHDGLDLATYCGDLVRAAHDGVVLYAGRRFDPYLGYDQPLDAFYARLHQLGVGDLSLPIVVVVDDGDGYRSVYVHLAVASVRAGQRVQAGQTVLGREGMTCNATGCHLHYEVIRMDGPWVAVAPQEVARLHYPAWVRERVDPLLVLDLLAPGAARRVPGLDPPSPPPSGYTFPELLDLWRLRDAPLGPPHV